MALAHQHQHLPECRYIGQRMHPASQDRDLRSRPQPSSTSRRGRSWELRSVQGMGLLPPRCSQMGSRKSRGEDAFGACESISLRCQLHATTRVSRQHCDTQSPPTELFVRGVAAIHFAVPVP